MFNLSGEPPAVSTEAQAINGHPASTTVVNEEKDDDDIVEVAEPAAKRAKVTPHQTTIDDEDIIEIM